MEAGMYRWLFALLIIAGLCAVVVNVSEVRNFVRLAYQARPEWLIAALLLQLSTYASVAASWALVLRATGTPRPIRMLFPLSLSKLFADQAIPTAGVSGNVLLVRRLIASGIPHGSAACVLVLSIVGYYVAYFCLALLVLVLLWLHHEATTLLASSISVFLLLAMGIPTTILILMRRGGHLPTVLARIGFLRQMTDALRDAPTQIAHDPRIIAQVSLLNALVFVADAATLQVALIALGESAPFSTALIAAVMASIAVTLGPIPMGLGSFEAVCIAMLRLLGIPLEPAVAATLLLRGLTLWLPLIPGLLFTRKVLHSGPKRGDTGRGLRPDRDPGP